MSAKDDLIDHLSHNPHDARLVTGVATWQVPASSREDRTPPGPPVLVAFVEPVADCELESLDLVLRRIAPGALLLRTGRFVGLQAHSGDSIGPRAPARYNLPAACAGTLGARVQAANTQYILSSNHVMAHNGRVKLGTSVVTPATLDDPSGGSEIGSLAHFIDLEPAPWPAWNPKPKVNTVDCALANVTTAGAVQATTPVNLFSGGDLNGVPVKKNGRTTATTHGIVSLWDCAAYIDFDFATCFFDDLFGVFDSQPFAAPGDSGALVLTDPGDQGLGLVTARAYSFNPSGQFTGYFVLMCRLNAVAQALAKELNIDKSQLQFFL